MKCRKIDLFYRAQFKTGLPLVFLSEGGQRLFGSDAKKMFDTIHPDDRDQVWRSLQDAARLGREYDICYRLTGTGQDVACGEVQVRDTGIVCFDKADHPVAIEGHAVAAGGLPRDEGPFAAFEDVFGVFATQAGIAVWQTDTDHRIVYSTGRFFSAMGGRSVENYRRWELPGVDRAGSEWDAHIADMEAHKPINGFRYRIRGGDGKFCWVELHGWPASDAEGNFAGYRGVAHDITDVIARKRDLEAERGKLNLLVKSSPAAIAMFDRDLRFMLVSDRWLDKFNEANDDVIGKTFYEVYAGIPEHWRETHQKCLAGVSQRGDAELYKGRDGKEEWLQWEMHPWRDGDGAVGGVVMSAEIVTEAKHAADALRDSKDEAERANLAKSDYLATMSHEIRTPMNGIVGMANLLLDMELGTEQRQYAEVLRDSGEALLVIINDILDYSKLEVDRVELESVEFDLAMEIEQLAKILSPRVFDKGVELVVDIDDSVPAVVCGDPTRLRQILFNLVGNAIKFTSKGHISIAVERLPDSDGNLALRFEVSDSGIGIDGDDLARLFEKFTQSDLSTNRRFGGSGLGLSICRKLVALFGGEIGVESVLNQGSTFWFTILLSAAPSRAAAAEPARTFNGLRVLGIEESAIARQSLGKHLQALGATATLCSSLDEVEAKHAEATNGACAFDVVIVGAALLRDRSAEIVEALGNMPALKEASMVIAITIGRSSPVGITRLFDDRILRPIMRSPLAACLGRVTEGAGAGADEFGERARAETKGTGGSARLLLAEDNPTNQLLATAMLRKAGHEVEVVQNGKLAVEAVEAGDFDLVLMDIQMPEMDGVTATRIIRGLSGAVSEIPIIAMTANAMAGQRESYIAAGMTDYLSKPIDRELMIELIARHTASAGEGASEGAGSADKRTEPALPVLDPAVVAEIESLFGGQNLTELVEAGLADASAGLVHLSGAVRDGDLETLQCHAHELKTTLGTLGAVHAAALLDALQRACAQGRRRQALGMVESVSEAIVAAQIAIGAHFADVGTNAPPQARRKATP